MKRALLFAPLILAVFAPLSSAKRIAAPPNPIQRAFQADVVVVGKVTAIEKETVEVADAPGAAKIAYAIAVIKVETGLSGAANLTHVKVGFVPPAPNAPPRRGAPSVALEAKQEGLFFLTKHSSGQFYTFNWMASPVDARAENFKTSVANVKKAYAVLAEPEKALKAEKLEDRTFAAVALILRYRSTPQVGEVVLEKVPAAESTPILKSLAEADWSKFDPNLPAPSNLFYMLGLTTEDGWAPPKPQPGADFNEELRKAFSKWLDGPGKDYRINKMVKKK